MQFYQNDLRLLSEFLESKELKFAHYIEKFPNTPTYILFRQFSLLQILFDSCLSTQFELKRMSSQFLPKLIDSLLYNSPNFLITILSILINSMKQSATPKHVDSTIALNPTAISKIKPILAQISKTTLEKTLALKKLVSHDISEFEILSNETKQNFRKIIAEIDSGVNCISDFVECVMMRPTSTLECFHALKVAMVLTKYRYRDFVEVSVPSPSHGRKFGEDEDDEIDLDELKTTNNRKIGSSILKVFNFAMEAGLELSKSCFERMEHDFGSKMSIRNLSRAGSEFLGDSMGVLRRKSPVGSKDSLHKGITPNGSSFRLNAKNSFHELKAAETHKSIFKEYLEISSKFHPGFINVDNDRRKEITEELSAQKKVLQNLIISMDPKLWQDFIFSLSGQDMLIYLPHLTSLAISNSVLRPTLFQCIQKFLISIIKSKKPRFISQNPVIQKILHNPVSVVKNSGGSNSCLSDGLTRRLSQRKPWKRRFVGTNVKSIGVVLKIKEAKWDEEDLEIYNADILKCSTVLANWLGEVMETKRFGANSLKLVLDTIYLYHIILQSKEILRNDISHILSRIQQDSVLSLELSQRKNLESSSDSNEGDIDNNSGAMDDDSEDEEEHGDLIDVPTNRNEVKEVARLIKSQFRNLKALYDAPVVKQKGNSLPWIVLQDIGDSIFENVLDEFYADSLHNGEIFDWLN
ncbi:hypothetical protein HK098_001313 [Nowakowskiella sp. JEL0407]|nr:hypothetical protein HK098_001313 [Nowakowskiella sp. JEL0407]